MRTEEFTARLENPNYVVHPKYLQRQEEMEKEIKEKRKKEEREKKQIEERKKRQQEVILKTQTQLKNILERKLSNLQNRELVVLIGKTEKGQSLMKRNNFSGKVASPSVLITQQLRKLNQSITLNKGLQTIMKL